MTRFAAVLSRIEALLPLSPLGKSEADHAQLVLKWGLTLNPEADCALRLAALSHDIDRAITGVAEKDRKDDTPFECFKRAHAKRSGAFTAEIMKAHDYDDETITKVKALIEKHEEGGDQESNTLMDADSLAFFQGNIPSYLERNGRDKTVKKIGVMYNRLSLKGKRAAQRIRLKDRRVRKLLMDSIIISENRRTKPYSRRRGRRG